MKKTQHFLTGEEFGADQITELLQVASVLKHTRSTHHSPAQLKGHHLALLFAKPSLRTRFSFTIAMRELGGDVVESIEATRKTEAPEDQARVLSGYCQAIMARTNADSFLTRMSAVSGVPVINGLSDLHHPCQILADLLTLKEHFLELTDLTLSYIGDGNNILHSLLLIAPIMGIHVNYCCPATRQPDATILVRAQQRLGQKTGKITAFTDPISAVEKALAVYTDVWTSMGFEHQSYDETVFNDFQVNEHLMGKARPGAVFMHCLPMERGKEVSDTLPDQPCSVIFQQSENRLHVQKALLLQLMAA